MKLSCSAKAFWARPIALATAVLLAGALNGCITLLPKAKPAQLYHFGDSSAAAAVSAAPQGTRPLGVVLGTIGFPRAAVGDQMFTVTGDTAAYISGARWVAPAAVLFQEDTERAFDRQARVARLLPRGELGHAAALLRLDVQAFETRYQPGAGAPSVVVSVHAALSIPGGGILDERGFDVRQPAADNRVSAIVAAYDQATTQVLSQLIAWTDETTLRASQSPPLSNRPAAARSTP